MFRDLPEALRLELIEAQTLDTGTVLHVYQPSDSAPRISADHGSQRGCSSPAVVFARGRGDAPPADAATALQPAVADRSAGATVLTPRGHPALTAGLSRWAEAATRC
jgi:hypothetical protein